MLFYFPRPESAYFNFFVFPPFYHVVWPPPARKFVPQTTIATVIPVLTFFPWSHLFRCVPFMCTPFSVFLFPDLFFFDAFLAPKTLNWNSPGPSSDFAFPRLPRLPFYPSNFYPLSIRSFRHLTSYTEFSRLQGDTLDNHPFSLNLPFQKSIEFSLASFD